MKQQPFSRRRFIRLVAAASASTLACPMGVLAARGVYRWRGEALGASSEMTLILDDEREAARLSELCLAEIARLEQIFSLYLPGSSIRQLNARGEIKNPPEELVQVLRQALRFSELSGGVFDVSIQPLWKYLFYLEGEPEPKELERRKSLVDFRAIEVSKTRIAFGRPGMEITLNGIAQGFITDKITGLLKANGIRHVLVQLGENFGLGANMAGDPWRIGIENSAKVVELSNRALATSGAYGTRFGERNERNHLIDATTAHSLERYGSVSVIGDDATTADGLSTTLALLPQSRHAGVMKEFPGTRKILL